MAVLNKTASLNSIKLVPLTKRNKMESQIIFGDCMDELPKIPNNSIDCIITDPPYFIPASMYGCTLRLKGKKIFNRNFGDLGIMEYFFKNVFNQFKRIIKSTGVIYIFCDGQSYPLFYYHLFHFCKSVRPLIWDKKVSVNGYSWRHQHEIILFAEMPESKPIPSGDGDILKCQAIRIKDREHQTEKPIELIKRLINKSTNKDDVILDCFGGSGSVMIACIQTNRNYIIIEKEKTYYDIIVERAKNPTLIASQSILTESLINVKISDSAESSTIKGKIATQSFS